MLLRGKDESRSRTAKRLVRSGRNDVGVFHRTRMRSASNQPTDVCHIGDQHGAYLVRNFSETGEINDTGVGTRPDHYHLRSVLSRQPRRLLVVDLFVIPAHTVGDDIVETP